MKTLSLLFIVELPMITFDRFKSLFSGALSTPMACGIVRKASNISENDVATEYLF